MTSWHLKGIFPLIIFLIIFCHTAYAGGDTVVILDPTQDYSGTTVDNTGADGTLTFWQVPRNVQISLVIGALTTLLFTIKFIIPVFRTRLKKHKTEEEVLQYIIDNPGANISQISKNHGININTVRHYIRKLINDNKIVIAKIGKYTRAYKNSSTYDDNEKIIIAHYNNENNKKILQQIINNPGTTNKELAETFKTSESTMSEHLAKLTKNNMITYKKEGKYKKYYIQNNVIEVLKKHEQL